MTSPSPSQEKVDDSTFSGKIRRVSLIEDEPIGRHDHFTLLAVSNQSESKDNKDRQRYSFQAVSETGDINRKLSSEEAEDVLKIQEFNKRKSTLDDLQEIESLQEKLNVPIPYSVIAELTREIIPPAFLHLDKCDRLYVKAMHIQALSVIENINDQFLIIDEEGNPVYFAGETSGFCMRHCLRGGRPFEVDVLDKEIHTVMKIIRRRYKNYKNFAKILPVDISLGSGVNLGCVKQVQKCFGHPMYNVLDSQGVHIMTISGPSNSKGCHMSCPLCQNVQFTIHNLDQDSNSNESIGFITRDHRAIGQELFDKSSRNLYHIEFPKDLDRNSKGLLIGALFLIIFVYFERPAERCFKFTGCACLLIVFALIISIILFYIYANSYS